LKSKKYKRKHVFGILACAIYREPGSHLKERTLRVIGQQRSRETGIEREKERERERERVEEERTEARGIEGEREANNRRGKFSF
jgi:hypothetical protein